MITTPELKQLPTGLTDELLTKMLEKLDNINFIAQGMAHPNVSLGLREECAESIREQTLIFGAAMKHIKLGLDEMDSQIRDLIAHAKLQTTPGLN